jgi:hypothetical protein
MRTAQPPCAIFGRTASTSLGDLAGVPVAPETAVLRRHGRLVRIGVLLWEP